MTWLHVESINYSPTGSTPLHECNARIINGTKNKTKKTITTTVSINCCLLLFFLCSSHFWFLFSHFYFPASGQAVVTGVVPSSPRVLPFHWLSSIPIFMLTTFFLFSQFYFPASGQAVVTGVVPSLPPVLA